MPKCVKKISPHIIIPAASAWTVVRMDSCLQCGLLLQGLTCCGLRDALLYTSVKQWIFWLLLLFTFFWKLFHQLDNHSENRKIVLQIVSNTHNSPPHTRSTVLLSWLEVFFKSVPCGFSLIRWEWRWPNKPNRCYQSLIQINIVYCWMQNRISHHLFLTEPRFQKSDRKPKRIMAGFGFFVFFPHEQR